MIKPVFPLLETFAEPSLQATQMKLKRARLADDLNEKIAQRPGPMELVEKNILPVDSSVKEAIIGKTQILLFSGRQRNLEVLDKKNLILKPARIMIIVFWVI